MTIENEKKLKKTPLKVQATLKILSNPTNNPTEDSAKQRATGLVIQEREIRRETGIVRERVTEKEGRETETEMR